MPERTFGRTVRYRRTKLGLSQANLGELVGRSPSTIRSWERDKSAPTEASVLHTLAAILGVDERLLFEKAGQEMPPHYETSPTLEEALASLHPGDESESSEDSEDEVELEATGDRSKPTGENAVPRTELPENQLSGQEPESDQELDRQPKPDREPVGVGPSVDRRTGYLTPPESYVVTPTSPTFVEPSYMEDSNQRQLYRVRNLATLVVVVALVIAFIWAVSESLAALGAWWNDFFGSLRL